ncbi:radical SAM/SPASM domain-containing protein [Mesorhizobium huakuii]|uniref:Radical SAM protein n=1 Tax=Mesorhizobium huakuii TaxID=28104 RepID=A0A7G6T564_9HYPH|nr:radical SAM protein [Mesorhizobium huakuii]QND61896.1 radical SAM protein [Mesorhizobium huakuii]QND69283.1 radical SAM protein [Mesorhizobium loti]
MTRDHIELLPQLKKAVRLKPMHGYALVHARHPSQIRMVDPSHAFFLSLCDRTLLTSEIAYIYGQTFGLTDVEAKSQVDQLLRLYRQFLTFEAKPNPTERFSPQKFLYPADTPAIERATFGKWPVPAGISFTLTFNCNFSCSYCYQDRHQRSDRRWNLNKCLELLGEAADWGVVFVGLTGGEPTLFDGWLQVVERTLTLGMIPAMTSNGTVIGTCPDIALRLAAAGMEEMTISLDVPSPQLHDQVTRSRGHFPKVIDAIRFLRAAGIRVVVKSVLTPTTQHAVEETIDLLVDLGVAEVGISYMESGAIKSPANRARKISSKELARVRNRIERKREQYAQICAVHSPKDSIGKWNDSEWYPCGGINMGMSIFPSGDVAVCDKMHGVRAFTYGNVFSAGLKAIWDSEAFAVLRARTANPKVVDPDCARCSKLHLCRTSCFVDSFNVTGSYFCKAPSCGGPFFN